MPPMAAAAAVPLPLMAPNSILATILVWAREPGRHPLISLAQLTSRMAMPPLFIMLPARIKKGMASSENEFTPVNIFWAQVTMPGPKGSMVIMASADDIPILMPMGTPITSMTTTEIIIIIPAITATSITLPPYCTPCF